MKYNNNNNDLLYVKYILVLMRLVFLHCSIAT